HIYRTMTAMGGTPENGFSATVAQFAWTPPPPAPLASIPTAPPADRDVGARARSAEESLSPGARAELERQVRHQLRRELEDEVRAEIAAEVRRDEEQRIRQELQIQVRRQLLSELTPNLGASGLTSRDTQGGPPARMPYMGDRTPKPMRITSEQSPEALEVFREEAQEHLLAITTGIANLETNPNDMGVLQSIRRAMHTLKGAAGLLGVRRTPPNAPPPPGLPGPPPRTT